MATLWLGCGEKSEEKVVINVGFMSDYTGPGAIPLRPISYTIHDLVRHINEEDPIPGAEIRIVTYDARFDPARDVPGFDWCVERGARVILTPQFTSPEVLKPFAERAKVPIFTWASTPAMIEPPGWVFCVNPTFYDLTTTLIKWVSEQWPNYPTTPKIGYFGWSLSNNLDAGRAIEDYCQAHPDRFEFIGSVIVPMGTMSYSGWGLEKLKECDYLCTTDANLGSVTFLRDFRVRGYTATIISTDAFSAGKGLYLDMCGWEGLDGTLVTHPTLWWNDPNPIVDLAKELLYRYHPEEAEDMMYQGLSYIGSIHGLYFYFDLLREAIEEVGAENLDGQAVYNTAIKFKTTYEGFREWGYTETKRVVMTHAAGYEWSAEAGDLVRVSDWMPIGE